jgi:LPXTG-motif cell wall-anchored protein
MMHRALVRVAVVASAALVAGVVAAAPASAAPAEDPIGTAKLKLDKPTTAAEFATRSCDGIPGGAKANTDGWVFNQPFKTATDLGYIFGLADPKAGTPYVLLVDDQGAHGLDLTKLGKTSIKSDGKVTADELKSLTAGGATKDKAETPQGGEPKGDAPKGDTPKGDEPKGETPKPDAEAGLEDAIIPAPAGVAGGLLADKGGVWLQTPAGWLLASGALVYQAPGANDEGTFNLLRTCAPKAAGTGGGTGATLPVTGANVGILVGVGVLLVALGGGLLMLRRRRESSTEFVA